MDLLAYYLDQNCLDSHPLPIGIGLFIVASAGEQRHPGFFLVFECFGYIRGLQVLNFPHFINEGLAIGVDSDPVPIF
jgi:hypothetical protein